MFALVGTVWQKEISFSRQIYDAAVRHYFTRPLLNHTFLKEINHGIWITVNNNPDFFEVLCIYNFLTFKYSENKIGCKELS